MQKDIHQSSMYAPDYRTLREEAGFSWSVSATYLALLDITGLEIKKMFLEPSTGIELYRTGRKLLKEMFGPEVGLPAPATPPIGYGHIYSIRMKT